MVFWFWGFEKEVKSMENDCVLLTIKQVSSMTGLAVGTLYHFVSQRRIPIVRISARCVRFRRSDIDAWLAERVIPPERDNIQAPHLQHGQMQKQERSGEGRKRRGYKQGVNANGVSHTGT